MKRSDTLSQSANGRRGFSLILILSSLTIIGLAWYGPIPQQLSYHDFADQRTLLSIPHFWNVVSNFPFVLVGLIGLYRCSLRRKHYLHTDFLAIFTLFFAGVVMTGISSAYYHLQPDNLGLFWDRSAMAISFMAFLSLIITAFISSKSGRFLLVPLILFGFSSVIYWIATEFLGSGDLRAYAATQYLPVIIIPVILFYWKSLTIKPYDILYIGAGYGLAKILELLDAQVFQLFTVSGHSLKHLAAAFSAYWVLVISGRYLQAAGQHHC